MRIIFFQNCISPHQMPYISYLPKIAQVEKVIVVTPVADLEERKMMGWGMDGDNFERLEIIVSPSDDDVKRLIEDNVKQDNDTWCMFSGINAFPEVANWLRLSLPYSVRRGIITEPPYIYEHPLWMHAMRFAIQDWRYVKYIDKMFVMGDEYMNYYKFWSKKWDVVPFMYCTEWKNRTSYACLNGKLKILYVGSLTDRKNVGILFDAVSSLDKDIQEDIELGIVGDGEKKDELMQKSSHEDFHATTTFYGVKNMKEVPEIMEQYDILVLPSKHDGWGAVVNEALTMGLYVVCSDACGAKYLIKNSTLGLVFCSNSKEDLRNVLISCHDNKDSIRLGVEKRVSWSKDNISGEEVAKYFVSHLQ